MAVKIALVETKAQKALRESKWGMVSWFAVAVVMSAIFHSELRTHPVLVWSSVGFPLVMFIRHAFNCVGALIELKAGKK